MTTDTPTTTPTMAISATTLAPSANTELQVNNAVRSIVVALVVTVILVLVCACSVLLCVLLVVVRRRRRKKRAVSASSRDVAELSQSLLNTHYTAGENISEVQCNAHAC